MNHFISICCKALGLILVKSYFLLFVAFLYVLMLYVDFILFSFFLGIKKLKPENRMF